MILIGQYDSPFVRRVGIALCLYEIPFEHRTWSVFSDAEKVRALNPLMRVPTLVLDDGTVLVDSPSMIDHLDHIVPPERALFPLAEPARHKAMRVASLAMGATEKAVSAFYEQRMHSEVSATWLERCRSQARGTMALLEKERRAIAGDCWFGDRIGHADIAVAVGWRFMRDTQPDLLEPGTYPALAADVARLEALPVFREISQPFVPPA